jgi:hypothetical protein
MRGGEYLKPIAAALPARARIWDIWDTENGVIVQTPGIELTADEQISVRAAATALGVPGSAVFFTSSAKRPIA